jgi:hypothetical protein
MNRSTQRWAAAAVLALCAAVPAAAQRRSQPWTPPDTSRLPEPAIKDDRAPDDPARIADAVNKAVELLLAHQEDMDAGDKALPENKAEWPYEGVYRVNRQIPIGYRIGGTALAATCLLRVPGYDKDTKRQEAVARAVRFISEGTKHPLMSADDYTGSYDVRGWGYTCALAFLLELKADKAIPTEPRDAADRVEQTIKWAIDGIQKTEIPTVGGWNYARGPKDEPSPASPFMTGPTLQALFEAKRQGYAVDDAVITRALDALERCRCSTGSFVYAAEKASPPDRPEPVAGSVGRMLVGEVTLSLAGRSDVSRIRGAIDAFFTNWAWLLQRKSKPGTHEGPYHIAPYYFYYAHFYAAQAIELLPKTRSDEDRKEYRRRLAQLLFSVQQEDGSWNDRVFPRTSAYGTSMAVMGLLMPSAPPLARFSPNASPSPQDR